MDIFDVIGTCARRWYLFLPLMLVVAWLGDAAYDSVKGDYYSNMVVGFTSPNSQVNFAGYGAALPSNGLMDTGGAPLVVNMTAVGLEDPAVVSRVVSAGGLPSYSAKVYPARQYTVAPPQVLIEATGPDRADVLTTLRLVVAQTSGTLKALQQNAQVPEDRMIKAFVVSAPSVPSYGAPSRVRSTIVIIGAASLLAILGVVVVDAVLTNYQARRGQSATTGARPSATNLVSNVGIRREDVKPETNS